MKPAVFFDRDGILNEAVVRDGTPHPPGSLEELRFAPGAANAVRRVRDAGFLAIVVTNQPDVARGTTTEQRVEEINAMVAAHLALDAVYCCFHDDGDRCDCRKPKPGLLVRARNERGIDLHRSFMVGDRVKDVECGRSAGCATIFVDFGYAETPPNVGADLTVESLDAAIDAILQRWPPA